MTNVDKILDQKVGKISLVDGALIGASKLSSEMLLAQVPFIGNGTLKSGLMKTIGAVGLSFVSNHKAIKIASTGVLIDGMEDLALGVKRYVTQKWGKGNSQSSEVGAFA